MQQFGGRGTCLLACSRELSLILKSTPRYIPTDAACRPAAPTPACRRAVQQARTEGFPSTSQASLTMRYCTGTKQQRRQPLVPDPLLACAAGCEEHGFSEELSLMVPGGVDQLPVRIGVIGDLGEWMSTAGRAAWAAACAGS